MVYRQRDKITIINLQGEKEKVLFDELEQVILNKPSNIVYCERDRVLQGIISMGDICRARDKGNNFVMVNTQFMCATGMSYRVYYSTGSLETADFISAGVEVPSVPGEWTRYEATLPDGARYFAIRSCATGSFMLMLDDVTYQPASTGDLALTGYNVYRDREKVNTDAVTTTSFTDTTDEPGKHTWTVTAVYAQGESRGSNTATPDLSSISTEMAASISISAAHGEIIVDGAEGLNISVASTDGRLIFNNIGQAETHIEVASGIYIVKAGTTTAKLIVR